MSFSRLRLQASALTSFRTQPAIRNSFIERFVQAVWALRAGASRSVPCLDPQSRNVAYVLLRVESEERRFKGLISEAYMMICRSGEHPACLIDYLDVNTRAALKGAADLQVSKEHF